MVSDLRQTRVFQEAMEKGREVGREEVALRLLALGRPIAEIAKATSLTAAHIRKLKTKSQGG